MGSRRPGILSRGGPLVSPVLHVHACTLDTVGPPSSSPRRPGIWPQSRSGGGGLPCQSTAEPVKKWLGKLAHHDCEPAEGVGGAGPRRLVTKRSFRLGQGGWAGKAVYASWAASSCSAMWRCDSSWCCELPFGEGWAGLAGSVGSKKARSGRWPTPVGSVPRLLAILSQRGRRGRMTTRARDHPNSRLRLQTTTQPTRRLGTLALSLFDAWGAGSNCPLWDYRPEPLSRPGLSQSVSRSLRCRESNVHSSRSLGAGIRSSAAHSL